MKLGKRALNEFVVMAQRTIAEKSNLVTVKDSNISLAKRKSKWTHPKMYINN